MRVTENGGRVIEWRVSDATYQRFRDLWVQLNSTLDGTPEYEELKDLIRSLPNFPHRNDPERDLIRLVVTTIN